MKISLLLVPAYVDATTKWWSYMQDLVLTDSTATPASRCCFKDGQVISLKADTGWYLGRCNNCVPGGAYPDSAFVHVSDPSKAKYAQWRVFNTCDGKIVLQADTGKYLARCNKCAPGAAYPDEAFVHVDDWHAGPWATWMCIDAGNGKIGLQSDTERYLARCNNCLPGAYPNTAFVHANSITQQWAQWTVESSDPDAGICHDSPQTPTPSPDPRPSPPIPSPSTPTPSTPTPSTPTPSTPAPSTPTPSTPTPSTPAPSTPTPSTPTPSTPAPSTPKPTVSTPIPTESVCPPRIRKAWSAMTDVEKELYKSALEQAMLRGYHHKFIEIHLETKSEYQAHDCLFFLWHRRFLLAYENMLRSLGTSYRCITIPFWDFGTLSAKFGDGQCKTFTDCNPLLSDMGAQINGISTSSQRYDVSNTPLYAHTCIKSNHTVTRNFCQSQDAYARKQCYKCIPRNNWNNLSPPSDTYISNIYNQLFNSKPYSFNKVTIGVQYRYHNTIHGALSATMGTFASPGDPIFYIHHATVDALYAIYYKCVVPNINIDLKDPRVWPSSTWSTSDGGWSRCKKSNSVNYQPSDTIIVNIMNSNGVYVDVNDRTSPLKEFFDPIGKRYQDYYNVLNLGEYSYQYDFGESSLKKLYNECENYGKTTTQNLMETNTIEILNDLAIDSKEDNFIEEMYQLCKKQGVPENEIMERINWMHCVFHNECKSGVFDYSSTFRENFRIKNPPYCYTTIQDLTKGLLRIGVVGWETIYAKHYTCQPIKF